MNKCSTNTVYSGSGKPFISSGDIVSNPTGTPSVEEAEADDSEFHSFITQNEVIEVDRKLLSYKGWMRFAMSTLKFLSVVGLCWLTHLCNVEWQMGSVPIDWQTGVVVILFKKGDQRVCSNYQGFTLLNPPGKICSRVLERRIPPKVKPWIQEEQ